MSYTTKSGRVLTDEDMEALADEAERGYDIDKLLAQPRRRIADEELRVLLDLWMVNDPWKLSPEAATTFYALLERESRARGFDGVVDAFHRHLTNWQPLERDG